MHSKKLAEIISIILGPHFWLPLLLVVFFTKTQLTSEQIKILLPTMLIFQVIVPISYIFIALKLKKVSAWDLPIKEERYFILSLMFISYLITLLMTYVYGNLLIFHLNLILFILLTITSFITYFWKISIHAILNTFGAIFINFLFNWQFPIIYLVIPIIIWARYKLGRHDFKQLLAGIILGIFVVWEAFCILIISNYHLNPFGGARLLNGSP